MTLSAWTYFKLHGLKRRLGLISHNDTLLAFYELGEFPASYDVVYVMIAAQARAISKGLTKVRMVVVDGSNDGLREEDPEYHAAYPPDQRNWVVSQVLEQVPRLAPLCGRTATRLTEHEARRFKEQFADYLAIHMEWQWNPFNRIRTEAHAVWPKHQKEIGFRAGDGARRLMGQWLHAHGVDKPPIVLTIRDRKWSQGRNSEAGTWLKFAHYLKSEGIPAVVIPDTERLFERNRFDEWNLPICVPASLNTELRLALCEQARMNFTVNTGPGTLLLFTNNPYRYFSNLDQTHESSKTMWAEAGLPPGQQLSSTSEQKILWTNDSLEHLVSELQSLPAR